MAQKQGKWWVRGDPKTTWDDTVACIGQDFSDGKERWGQESVQQFAVARYLETWEIGCPIYWDEEEAKKVGYRGQVAPWTSIKQTFVDRSHWRPGDPTRFPSADMNAAFPAAPKPEDANATREPPMPPTTDVLATEVTIEFYHPLIVGDKLANRGNKLVQVRPRQTRIGFGAFLNWENEYINQRGEVVARVNAGNLYYNPGTEGPK